MKSVGTAAAARGLGLADPGGTVYELARLKQWDEPYGPLAVVAGIVLVLLLLLWTVWRRDTVEQRPWIRGLLLALRVGVLAGLVVFFLQPQRRTVRQVVRPSRVLVLVDVSQSMAIKDGPTAASRIEQVTTALSGEALIDELRQTHDVVVLAFDARLREIATLPAAGQPPPNRRRERPAAGESPARQRPVETIDWQSLLTAQGVETRIGSAVQQALELHRGTPVAAVILLTDGANNAGVDPRTALAAAQEANVPLLPVGIGSAKLPANVRVSDLVAPSRVHQNDAFQIAGYLQSHGMEGRNLTVELLSVDRVDSATATVVDSQRVVLAGDGQVVTARFEVNDVEPGRRTYQLRVQAPADDHNAQDNLQTVEVEVVGRQSHVLLLAGGPTREYRFVRNLLWRDKDVRVDVLLQSAAAGISQDADTILTQFPHRREDLLSYDAVIAFDPDWTSLDQSQQELLEDWIANQGGGLIGIAGPVATGTWTQSAATETIRDLYPVQFYRHVSLLDDVPEGAEAAARLEFTPAGVEAEFLWLGPSRDESESAWAAFPGVYSYWPVKAAKPGATVYAHWAGSDSGLSLEQPVYMAEHFYGSGRVFYLGSGEMWRLRMLDEAYFEMFYTKLVRHVSQGRFLRGRAPGILLVERDRYVLGATIAVRVQLDKQVGKPTATHLGVELVKPDGTTGTVVLQPDPARPAAYWGQFTADQEGVYRLDLAAPDRADPMASRYLQVRVPDRERDHPQRNDALLSELAQRSGGHYYLGMAAALGTTGGTPLVRQIEDRTETSLVAGAPDRRFEQALMTGLLIALAGMLCLEWLVRRLCRLA